MEQIVRAVDVGYGNTKYVTAHAHGEEVHCSLFPSIAPHAGSTPELGAGVLQRRNTVIIEANGIRYEVGKEAHLAQDVSHGRILDPTFATSDTYLALIRGAFFYMGVKEVDLLVVGLPVSTWGEYKDKMQARLVGTHEIPNIGRAADGAENNGETIKVVVKQIQVLPQPLGAFFDYSIRNNLYKDMKNQMNLLIDPGFYTTDWLLTHGTKPIESRSGSHSGGMSTIIASIAESVGKKLGTQINDLTPIDTAIRTNTKPRFFGQEFDLTEYLVAAKSKSRQFVSVLANKVGSGVDVDNIILAGGGAEFFREAIQEKFPKHTIITTKDPVYANVRGFQVAGEEWLRAASTRKQRAAEMGAK